MWKERQTEIDKNVGKKESKKNKTMVTYIRDKEKQTNVWERREGDTKRAKEKETRVWEERERETDKNERNKVLGERKDRKKNNKDVGRERARKRYKVWGDRREEKSKECEKRKE